MKLKSFFQRLMDDWSRPNGYRAVLRISLPLIVSMGSHTLMLVTDRLFLSHYALDAMAAAVPAGQISFLFLCLFMGIAQFTNTFVAQYHGAGQPERIGSAVWQGLYLAVAGGVILALLSFTGDWVFRWAGHGADLEALEAAYFRILMQGAVFALLQNVLSCFYSGRGKTLPVMLVNLVGVVLNIPLDYMLIFGRWGMPELGINGSAIATVGSSAFMVLLYLAPVFRRSNDRLYAVRRNRAFNWPLFMRLLKFGTPAGVQTFVDVLGFSVFMLMVGRLGRDALAATNIACSINLLAFMPMIGFSMAVSTLVGQAMGRGQPADGVTATRSALRLTFLYMWTLAALFLLVPGLLADLFKSGGDAAADFAAVRGLTVTVLRFVAFYSLFDTLNIIYSGALRGAGDTVFIGWTIAILSIFVLAIPVTLSVVFFGAGLLTAWSFLSAYVCLLAVVFRWRFRQGKWQHMSIIETVPPALAMAPLPAFGND